MKGNDISLTELCCTCLSTTRRLFQLCKLKNGVNNFYSLLSYDSEAYREGFYKDTKSLFMCWECVAVMRRLTEFQRQVCAAQRQLTCITEGQINKTSLHSCLSMLKISEQNKIHHILYLQEENDNFIDCGPFADGIKSEDDLDEVPLSELQNNCTKYEDDDKYDNNNDNFKHDDDKCDLNNETYDLDKEFLNNLKRKDNRTKKKTKIKNKRGLSSFIVGNQKHFSVIEILKEELERNRDEMRLEESYREADFKCDKCILIYDSRRDLEQHIQGFHTDKPNHLRCEICCKFIKSSCIRRHSRTHYTKYLCNYCDVSKVCLDEITRHMLEHAIVINIKKVKRKTAKRLKPTTENNKTQFGGYLCTECNRYFDNYNQRWKHVQRVHREGYSCATCGKRFAFKNSLGRHEILHKGSLPREECPICHKMIRTDLMKVHSLTHGSREKYSCAQCDKLFISRSSYEHHLKYTQAHAKNVDVLKYKCSMCDKGYRSRGELRDHVNYQHMGKTQHKCPVCGKGLATRRCITRHVKRAHNGVKENARDKICQQCGKAFRDKKGLREHEFIHTGERPLSCEICGGTFRQSASLYTHKKRVHKIYPPRKCVEII